MNMPKPPLVSIITPSYNQAQFIEETILAVKNQDYPNIEHIIVDGASTDSTVEILKRYDGTYNMRWISEADGGMYEAINKGFRLSRGDVLAYLNSDDRYFPWTVAVAVQAFQDHPEVGFVFGDMLNVKDGTDSVSLLLFPPFRLGYIQRSGFLGQPTVFWRRSVLDQAGEFDESLKFVADCDYWMRIGGCFMAHKVDEVLAIERDHAQAKRMAQTQALEEELYQVRSRYVQLDGTRHHVHALADKVYFRFLVRYHLLRFLYKYFRARKRPEGQGDGSWSHFMRSDTVIVSRRRALAILIPFLGRIFSKDLLLTSKTNF